MINTEEQYEYLCKEVSEINPKGMIQKYNKYLLPEYFDNSFLQQVVNLIVINKIFIDKYKSDFHNIKKTFLNRVSPHLIMLNLYKYISANVLNLFFNSKWFKTALYNFEIQEYFYFINKNLNNYNNELILKEDKLYYIINYSCMDINILNYCCEMINKLNIEIEIDYYNCRVPLVYSFKVLKKYTNMLYKPNIFYVSCNDSYVKVFINTIFTDRVLKSVNRLKWYIVCSENQLKKYNIDVLKGYNFKIHEKKGIINNMDHEKPIKFNNYLSTYDKINPVKNIVKHFEPYFTGNLYNFAIFDFFEYYENDIVR
ncbi:hypothetical protein BCR36DRAFT_363185 [Piromyces finnis]|uniref:Uncharacterized protein n=1 Tax=Piromyces finnis TaxID=1754191 RepID=A0A1Y1UWU2_9FUNG|nr:hypothetical protein BCR36DRAFT_363185 [Piromyces finnis]|eukprot:ORX41971.1 hypothetical protein BCR36DRAFT_363185 [Piromyces finnis]